MFEKFDEAASDVIAASRHECLRLRSPMVGADHLLLALTRDPMNIAARALASMSVKANNVQQELEKAMLNNAGRSEPEPTGISEVFQTIGFSESVRRILDRSNDFRLFFGKAQISPEHILLAIVDCKDLNALKILDELGANITFMKRQIFNLVAQEDCLLEHAPGVRQTLITGLNELIVEKQDSLERLSSLAETTGTVLADLPQRSDIALMVFLAYLRDFLDTQIASQRYLLEETIRLLNRRTGSLDKEVTATIVSSGAQHVRAEVRATIEYLWSHELRMLNQMPDEAEHDLVGSVIEDLWWTYSEEIALHDVFDEALDDYRRKQVLNLQERKIELSRRLERLRTRLDETIRQCFVKRTMSA